MTTSPTPKPPLRNISCLKKSQVEFGELEKFHQEFELV